MPVRIAYSVAREIADHAASEAPREACGLLAGETGWITQSLPLINIAPRPEAQFQLDPQQQLRALKAIDESRFKLLGIYHSHPGTPPIPSDEDINGAVDEGLLHLIVSLKQEKPRLKLWRIASGRVTPLELAFEDEVIPLDDSALSASQRMAIVLVGVVSLLILLVIAFSLLPAAPELASFP